MTNSPPTNEDFNAVHHLALTRTPVELIGDAMNTGAALLAHYHASLESWGTDLADIVASECGCENCSRDILALARNLSTAEAEKAAVVIAFDLIAGLSMGLPPADPGALKRVVQEVGS